LLTFKRYIFPIILEIIYFGMNQRSWKLAYS
jgi:hypothetical protein